MKWSFSKGHIQFGLILFTLVTLACGLTGRGSSRPGAITHLPTFTRTPLPPLQIVSTPNPAALQPAGEAPAAAETSPDAAAQPVITSPETTAMDENSLGDDGSANQAEAVVEESVATQPAAQESEALAANQPAVNEQPATQAPAAQQPAAAATAIPTQAPTNTVPPVVNPTATLAQPAPAGGGWAFTATRFAENPYDDQGIVLYGEAVNNTGQTQELIWLTGNFYDGGGQMIASDGDSDPYLPADFVPPGGRVPFELEIYDISGAANFELMVEAEPSTDPIHQDFEIINVEQWNDEGDLCFSGSVKNQGQPLQDYAVVFVVLYNDRGEVINFVDDYTFDIEDLTGDSTYDFEMCVEQPGESVARNEVWAWGS